jgi:hypothetical protein
LTPSRPAFDEKGWRAVWVTLGLVAVAAALWIGLPHVIFSVPKWLLFALWVVLTASGLLLLRLLMPRTPDQMSSGVFRGSVSGDATPANQRSRHLRDG